MTESDGRRWPQRLQSVLDERPESSLRTVRVVETTPSTQDVARAMGAPLGLVVVALAQTAGRGRLGRTWVDAGGEGLAMTAVVAAASDHRHALVGAVAAVAAAETWLGSGSAGIKWPNDVLVRGRKLAGVLVEQAAGRALIGVGLNVNQLGWRPPLAERAVSLREARAADDADSGPIDRLEVAAGLLAALADALAMSAETLAERFREADLLRGRSIRLRTAGDDGGWREMTGVVREIDPMRGLAVTPLGGNASCWLAAAQTTVLEVLDPPDGA